MMLQIRKRKKLLIFAIIILAIGIASYWGKVKYSQVQPQVIPVQVQSVKAMSIPTKITAIGTLRAPQDVKISAETAGYVTKIGFNDGQAVNAGDILFQLDDAKEQADLLSTQAAYQGAKNKLIRMSNLLKQHYVSEEDIDNARADLQAKLAAAKTAQDNVDKKAIKAPFSGMVGARTVNTGDFVTSGQKLVELVDRSVLKVDYSVPEKYLLQVKLDQPVVITIADSSERPFAGKVVYISPAIDPETHTLALQASVPNQDNALAPGLFVTISHMTGVSKQTVIVPEESLIKSPEKTIVYRVVANKAVETPVKVGMCKGGGYVEILSGLNLGDIIVTAGQEKLSNGAQVRVVSSFR